MKRLSSISIILILCMLSFTSTAQAKKEDAADLIVDETWVKESKANYIVKTASETVYELVLTQFGENVKRVIIMWKIDRNGRYKEYTLYFPVDSRNEIEAYMLKTWGKNKVKK